MVTTHDAEHYYCYLLRAVSSNRTYIGSTNDPLRRLQQHNGERSGGARSTRGEAWSTAACVSGFATRRQALSFEYSWRRCCRRRARLPSHVSKGDAPLHRRWTALHRLLTLGDASKKWFGEPLAVHCLEPQYYRSLHDAWQGRAAFDYVTVTMDTNM